MLGNSTHGVPISCEKIGNETRHKGRLNGTTIRLGSDRLIELLSRAQPESVSEKHTFISSSRVDINENRLAGTVRVITLTVGAQTLQ